MFDVGIQELMVIFIVALIVFGPKRLPEIGKMLGKAIMELKKAAQNVKEQMDVEMYTEQKLPENVYNPPHIESEPKWEPEGEQKSDTEQKPEPGSKPVSETEEGKEVSVTGQNISEPEHKEEKKEESPNGN